MLSTIFNPLIVYKEFQDEPNEALLDIFTSQNTRVSPAVDLKKAISLFYFENIWDGSQSKWISNGVSQFINSGQSLQLETLQTSLGWKTETLVDCIGNDQGIKTVAKIMKGIFENPSSSRMVDTDYHFPIIPEHATDDHYRRIGWLECRTGVFILADPDISKKMQSALVLS